MMRRRVFITLLGGAATVWPIAAHAQQRSNPVIGILSGGSQKSDALRLAAFGRGLIESGYVSDRNIAFEYRWAEGDYDRLGALATDLVRHQVTMIAIIGGTPVALAAKAARTTVPIVFVISGDPVRLGLVSSLNRPGGNITGVSTLTNVTVAKQFEVLHEAVPKAAVVAWLVNPINPNAATDTREAQEAARTLGLQFRVLNASSEEEISQAFATAIKERVGALAVVSDALFNSRPDQLAALAARYELPTIYPSHEFAMVGGLMSYGSSFADAYHQAGIQAARILNGEKPAELPVIQATKVELVLNLKTAKMLGVTFPITLLGRADEVIE